MVTKRGSVVYFSLIFLSYVVGALVLITAFDLPGDLLTPTEQWSFFFGSLIATVCFAGTFSLHWLRTLIHELKHAVMVLLTGNRLRGIQVKSFTGQTHYDMYFDTLRFAPVICLAPYFFPLFSLPVLLLCVFLELVGPLFEVIVLGIALGIDMVSAYGELHPNQSDLRKVAGGIYGAGLFIAGANYMWLALSCLWVLAGKGGYVHMWKVICRFVEIVAARMEGYFPAGWEKNLFDSFG